LIVREATAAEHPIWAAMLVKLHGWGDESEFIAEIPSWLALDDPMVCFLAFSDDGQPIGMADARVRNYAEGAPNLCAAYIEDIFVEEEHRRTGVARALLAAVEQWARAQGLNWLGSDTELGNDLSEAWHKGVGFKTIERLIVFGKPLD
jgi:aminoglycoside 6'-N-acetyltransferase I